MIFLAYKEGIETVADNFINSKYMDFDRIQKVDQKAWMLIYRLFFSLHTVILWSGMWGHNGICSHTCYLRNALTHSSIILAYQLSTGLIREWYFRPCLDRRCTRYTSHLED